MKTTNLVVVAFVSALALTATRLERRNLSADSRRLGSKPSVPDLDAQVAYQRAFEAVVWAMPASAIYRFRVGTLEHAGRDRQHRRRLTRGRSHKQSEAITPNTVTPYIAAFSDLRNGPIVVELPAKTDKASLYGQIVDAWQVTLADVGPTGLDKGAGGKYLLIPPGYSQPIPSGYFPIQSSSYRIGMAFRSVPAPGATDADAYAYSKTLKIYPLSEAANPAPTRFVDPKSELVHTLPFYDIRALQDIKSIIDVEPVLPPRQGDDGHAGDDWN